MIWWYVSSHDTKKVDFDDDDYRTKAESTIIAFPKVATRIFQNHLLLKIVIIFDHIKCLFNCRNFSCKVEIFVLLLHDLRDKKTRNSNVRLQSRMWPKCTHKLFWEFGCLRLLSNITTCRRPVTHLIRFSVHFTILVLQALAFWFFNSSLHPSRIKHSLDHPNVSTNTRWYSTNTRKCHKI